MDSRFKMRSKSIKGSTTPTKTQQVVYRCTSCNCVIKSPHEAELHPLLDVLVCLECMIKYGNGDFAKQWPDGVDELGDDNYCRWCCDGGNLVGCSTGINDGDDEETSGQDKCHYMFCEDCIDRNVPNDPYLKHKEAGEDEPAPKWYCFVCDKSKLRKLRRKAQAAIADLVARDPSSLVADVTPKNPIGRPPKNRDAANLSTPNTTGFSKPCPASKKPQAQAQALAAQSVPRCQTPPEKAESPTQDENMDVDILSVSPPKPEATKPAEVESVAVKEPPKEVEKKDEPSKAVNDNDTPTSETKSKDKDREAGRKSSITSSKDLDQSSAASIKESKKKKDNGLSKRDKEARVEGEPIVAPPDAQLFQLRGESIHKTRDIRRASDSFNQTANPTKKRRTDSISTESLGLKMSISNLKKISDNDKPSASTTKETGLEPQMIYNKTAPPTTSDRQSAPQFNGNSETKQNKNQSATNVREIPGVLSTTKNSHVKAPPPVETPKQKTAISKLQTNAVDIQKRLDIYNQTKQICIEEIGSRFEKIVEMMRKYSSNSDKGVKQSINIEIGGLRKPLQEFEDMVRDLENLLI